MSGFLIAILSIAITISLVTSCLLWYYGAQMKANKIKEQGKTDADNKNAGIALISFGVGSVVCTLIVALITFFKWNCPKN